MKNRLWFLVPLAGLYALVMEIRNGLFDRQWWSSVVPTIPSIGVGNLSVGGTGQSVVIDYLISH
jgi:tetraacyldisaccharide 4'-kinase